MTSTKILEVLTLPPFVRKIYVLFVRKFGVIFDPPPPSFCADHALTLFFFGWFWPKGRLSSFLLPEPIQGPKKKPMPKRE